MAQVKVLCNVAQETPDNIAQEKKQCNVVWVTSLFGDFYFEPVHFLIITSCSKCRANIAQEKSRANIEQNDKIVRNRNITLAQVS